MWDFTRAAAEVCRDATKGMNSRVQHVAPSHAPRASSSMGADEGRAPEAELARQRRHDAKVAELQVKLPQEIHVLMIMVS